MFDSDEAPEAIVGARGFRQLSDPAALDALIDTVLEANPEAVLNVRGGRDKAIGFLIGQVMQSSGGKANPRKVRELLAEKFGAIS